MQHKYTLLEIDELRQLINETYKNHPDDDYAEKQLRTCLIAGIRPCDFKNKPLQTK